MSYYSVNDNESVVFKDGDVIAFIKALPKFHWRLSKYDAYDYIVGDSTKYQKHMAREPTLKEAIIVMMSDIDSSLEQWVGQRRMTESLLLDREVQVKPWLPYQWANRPLPKHLYVDGKLPKGSIAGTEKDPAIELTDDELEELIISQAIKRIPMLDLNGTEEHLVSCLQPHQLAIAEKKLSEMMLEWTMAGRDLERMHRKAIGVFYDFFGEIPRTFATDELNRGDFPAAYKKILNFYLGDGMLTRIYVMRRVEQEGLTPGKWLEDYYRHTTDK